MTRVGGECDGSGVVPFFFLVGLLFAGRSFAVSIAGGVSPATLAAAGCGAVRLVPWCRVPVKGVSPRTYPRQDWWSGNVVVSSA